MTQLERLFLYRADWAWQRTEEAVLAVRYYWWCVQCASFVILPGMAKQYGMRTVVYCLKHAVHPAHVYESRHYWQTTEDEPVSAVHLIMTLRQERAQRERQMFLSSFDGPAMTDSGFQRIVQATPLHPLMDRDPDAWAHLRPATVRATAQVVYPDHETTLFYPEVWPESIRQQERVNA